ncbi:TetR/AcrR family transcriptional regulator [Altericroceibacterium endophyticum]|uniref:TetR family transcriptional regulator n=1 Tax=Altericroceibacterium endophyticum TaxID=1808508 RepID=A0A6I4T8W0_9SPHN|nr:TetR/AcrR family transcriptional regulator [Altericroceibacterium endophyticum]MXO67138.1 TetR family transcriptional regulator [Altericroceibacterium endophyticum]
MGRRSDHSREELRALFIAQGHALMAEKGLAAFSGREVAKRAGYSVGTIYNVFGSLDQLIAAINSHTFLIWAEFLRQRLESAGEDRIRALVEGYFEFALENPRIWSAIYDHRLAEGEVLGEIEHSHRVELTAIVETEVRAVLPGGGGPETPRFARSLIATVHGHCSYLVSGSFALLEESDPVGSALDRVRECLAAQR